MSGTGRGYDPRNGFDTGPPPPSFPPAQPYGIPQYPYGFPMPGQGYGYGYAPAPAPVMMPQYYGGGGGQTYPVMAPRTDHGFPGIHLRNDTGGVGLPPGYDYVCTSPFPFPSPISP